MSTLEKVGTRIARAREAAGISQSDLARALDITPQAVQKWESGISDPRFSKLADIAAAIHTTLADLLQNTRFEIATADLTRVMERDDIDKARRVREVMERHGLGVRLDPGSARINMRVPTAGEEVAFDRMRFGRLRHEKVPLISWELAAQWKEAMHTIRPGDAEHWFPLPFSHSPVAFCLQIFGESNYNPGGEKSYAQGEFIAVDPVRVPTNRSMVVVCIAGDDRATVKQLIVDPDGTKMLKALNPNWPKPFIEITDETEIIGTVIGKWLPE